VTRTLLVGLAAAAGLAAAPAPQRAQAAETACAPAAGLTFVCGIKTPQDLVALPGGRWVLTGAMATDGTGGLELIDVASKERRRLYPTAQAAARPGRRLYPDCAGPPDPQRFAAHGLSVHARRDGRADFYVIGHGGREAIEVFDLALGRDPSATWVGCVKAPTGASLNSVVGLGDGEILTTSIFDAPSKFEDVFAGRPTGNVYARKAGEPFRVVPGTHLSGDNGLEVSADGRWLFVAATGDRKVFRYERANMAAAPAAASVDFLPDNLRWAPDGRLLAAGEGPVAGCTGAACATQFSVAAITPASMAVDTILRAPATPAFSGVSAGIVVGDTVWLGAHGGDRIAIAPLER
jgi:hypothetical protein